MKFNKFSSDFFVPLLFIWSPGDLLRHTRENLICRFKYIIRIDPLKGMLEQKKNNMDGYDKVFSKHNTANNNRSVQKKEDEKSLHVCVELGE